MSLQYHPDKLGDKSDEDKAAGNAMFIKVAEAYAVLSDEESRRKYDLWVRSGRKRRPAPGDDMGPMPVMSARARRGRPGPCGPLPLPEGGVQQCGACAQSMCDLLRCCARHATATLAVASVTCACACVCVCVCVCVRLRVCASVPLVLCACVCPLRAAVRARYRHTTATIQCATCRTRRWRLRGWH